MVWMNESMANGITSQGQHSMSDHPYIILELQSHQLRNVEVWRRFSSDGAIEKSVDGTLKLHRLLLRWLWHFLRVCSDRMAFRATTTCLCLGRRWDDQPITQFGGTKKLIRGLDHATLIRLPGLYLNELHLLELISLSDMASNRSRWWAYTLSLSPCSG